MKKIFPKLFVLFLIIIIGVIIPLKTWGRTFNQNNIISDLLFRSLTLGLNDIQVFLQSKGSVLANLSFNVNGKLKKASEIIYSASRQYNLSPKILLTMLQKEHALISTQNPTQYQLDCATGYGVNRHNR